MLVHLSCSAVLWLLIHASLFSETIMKTSNYILFCRHWSLGHYELIEVKILVLNLHVTQMLFDPP